MQQITATSAYYMGRNDYWGEFPAEPSRAGAFSADYRRGYRNARAEDGLDQDIEWDSEAGD
jgi:hypothetical protein